MACWQRSQNLGILAFFALILPTLAPPSAAALARRGELEEHTTITTPPAGTTTGPYVAAGSTNGDCPNPCGYYGQLCCGEGQICHTDANNQAQCGTAPTSTYCENPCGYYGQLCCAPTERCTTDANNQAHCVPTSNGCPIWSTTTYTSTSSYSSTSTYIVTFTRTETGVQTIIGTASWQISPQPPGCCGSSTPLQCKYSLGETPCGDVCCIPGQYCQSTNQCVDVEGAGSAFLTTTYVETDFQTITTTYVQTDLQTLTTTITFLTPSVPAAARPTSGTVVTITSNGV